MIVLGIESSCDEMAAAVLSGDAVRSNVVHSQVEIHAAFGGVVPEIASRDHVRRVGFVIRAALEQAGLGLSEIEGLAVTAGPGLIGSLLCGVEAAKGLALATGRPLVGINHLEGHIAAAFLESPAPEPPFVALIVSGGHTSLVRVPALGGPYELLGSTRDDAAGEAFDKTAKLLGLGYPGGVVMDQLAQRGDPERFSFPKSMKGKDNLDFSFSGLKTAAVRTLESLAEPLDADGVADFCASFRAAVVENLLRKSFHACRKTRTPALVIVGGVAANQELRSQAVARGARRGIGVFLASRANSTDNAAMIARAGRERLLRGERDGLDLVPRAHWPLSELGRRG